MAVSRIPSLDGAPGEELDLYVPEDSNLRPEDYAVGKVLSGKFRVERVIGVGSMGVVLAATHLELDEKVAIKFIRSEVQKLPGVMSRFAREAKAAVRLKSEHIAQVLDVGVADGVGPYIVMEYMEGQDLAEILDREGPLEIRRAVHYVMQACEALAVAHANGITHRDIKPENLFVTRQGDRELVKLLDFGISKAALTGRVFGDELSDGDNACLLGTPLYMSPEQIRATDEVGHQSDIWSLGAVLYELITGRSAFVADSVAQVWNRILETRPGPLAHYCPHAPAELQVVIDRCLEKDPSRRYQNVADLAAALQAFAPSRARPYAQRASSILGRATDSGFPAPAQSLHPISSLAPSPLRQSVRLAPHVPGSGRPRRPSVGLFMLADNSTAPVSSRQSWAVPAPPPSKRRALLALAAGAAVVLAGLFALPRAPKQDAPQAVAQPSAAVALPSVAMLAAPASQAPVPTAAPALAPREPEARLANEAAAELPNARLAKQSAKPAAKPARTKARGRVAEPPPALAASSAKPVEDARLAPAAQAPARLVEDGPRVRLLPDQPRAQLLD
jgi:eukaryotic-like serine/threonine-protein kinase